MAAELKNATEREIESLERRLSILKRKLADEEASKELEEFYSVTLPQMRVSGDDVVIPTAKQVDDIFRQMGVVCDDAVSRYRSVIMRGSKAYMLGVVLMTALSPADENGNPIEPSVKIRLRFRIKGSVVTPYSD